MAKSAPLLASFNAGEWSPLVWGRSDLARYGAACRRVENFLPVPQGAATRRPGTRFIAATRDDGPARLVPFEFSVEQAYVIEFGDRYLRLYRDRARLDVTAPAAAVANGAFDTDIAGWSDISSGGGTRSWNAGGWMELRTNAAGTGRAEQAVTTGTPGATHILTFELKRDQQDRGGACTLGIGATSGADGILKRSLAEPGFYAIPFTPGVSPFYLNFTIGNPPGRVLGIDSVSILQGPAFDLPTPYPADALSRLKWTQSADVLYLAHPDFPPMKLARAGALDWSLSRIQFSDGPYLPVAKQGVLSASATAGLATVTSDIAQFAAGDVGRAIRLRHGSTWGWGVIVAVAGPQSVTVEVISAFGATGAATEYRLGAWSATSGFPSCVSFFEERLFFAGAKSRPQTVSGSVVGDYENHAPSQADGDVLDDSAVTFTIADDRVNAIRWMSAGKTLAIGTAGGEFSLSAAGVNEAVTPTPFPSESHERALDRLTLIAQELDEAAGRALHLPKGESGAPATLPAVPARAGHLLGFDLAGAPVAIAGAAPSLLVSSFAATLLDDGDAATARATLGAGAGGAAVFQAASAVAAQDATHANGADIASAATLNLDAATGDQVDVTGTTTITTIVLSAGRMRAVRFTGALILTHGASLVLPGAASIATAAGDVAVFRGHAGGVVRCVAYQRAATPPVTLATQAEMEAAVSNAAVVSPLAMKWHPGVAKAWVKFSVVGGVPVIDRAFNVSSITDNGVGDFTINFATAFSDANYCFIGNGRTSTGGAFLTVIEHFDAPLRTAAALRIYTLRVVGGGAIINDDPPVVSCVVFGDL